MKKKFVNIPFKVKIIIRETYLSRFNYRCVHLQTASYINTKAHISNIFIEDVKEIVALKAKKQEIIQYLVDLPVSYIMQLLNFQFF